MSRRLRSALFLGCFTLAAILSVQGCGGRGEQAPQAQQATPPGANPPGLTLRDVDERPPIIISDGSVDIYIDRAPDFGNRGSLNKTMTSGVTTVEHRYRTGASPINSFVVFLLNGVGDASECTALDHAFEVPSFTVVYGGSKKIAISASGGNFKAVFDSGQAVGDNGTHWKHAGAENERLAEIRFPRTQYSEAITCTFDRAKKRRGVITIYQSQATVEIR